MPNFFSKNSLFHYDPVSYEESLTKATPSEDTVSLEEENKRIQEGTNKLTTIHPSSNIADILKDLNRDWGKNGGNNFKINGKNALDLRKQDILTPKQYEIAKQDISTIDTMSLSKIKALVKPLIFAKIPEKGNGIIKKILDTPDIETARTLLKDYHKAINDKTLFDLTDLEDAKDFLKKHLLSSVKDDKEQDFLAEKAIRGLHQSGFTRAAEAYYTSKCNMAALISNKPLLIENNKENKVVQIAPAERQGDELKYINGRVYFTSSVHYQSMTDSNGKVHNPDVKVSSSFSIKASKPFFSKTLEVDFRVDKLDITMNKDKTLATVFKESQPKKNLLNYILEKLFGKTPSLSNPQSKQIHPLRKP